MKTKTRLLCVALCAVLCVALCLSSCSVLGGGYVTQKELDEVREKLNTVTGEQTINEGNIYNVSITGTKNTGLYGAGRGLLSTVSVYCNFTRSYKGFGPGAQSSTREYSSAGSGVIYRLNKSSGDAIIITNYHVVYDYYSNTKNGVSNDISVYLYGQEMAQYKIAATYVGGSVAYDIAVLKVSGSSVLRASSAMAATFADSDAISVMDEAIVIGNPEAKGISATAGHVNVDSEYISMSASDGTGTLEMRVIRIDAAVNSGNSGGGLYNASGELMGVVNAKMASSGVDNIGYAIPSNVAKYITENILYYCENTEKENVYRCLLGVSVGASASGAYYDTEAGRVRVRETVCISAVGTDGLAAGKLQEGDIIHGITIGENSYEVTRAYHVIDVMLNARVDSAVTFHITRGGENRDVEFVITQAQLTKSK